MPAEVVRKKFRGELLFYRKHYRPATMRKLCRKQDRRARWRMFALRIKLAVSPGDRDAQGKLARYRVIREEIANYPI